MLTKIFTSRKACQQLLNVRCEDLLEESKFSVSLHVVSLVRGFFLKVGLKIEKILNLKRANLEEPRILFLSVVE